MAILNDGVRALIDGKNYATVATINADGSPQTSVVWVQREGDELIFSTTRGRKKATNMERDPRISVSLFDQENPFDYAELRGTVTITEREGRALIDTLSRKYMGADFPADPPGTVRVIVRLSVSKVTGNAA